ncbi:MAG: cell division ATPase MinD, partial [Nanoarchaeota archaeon]|nr:cell division ATPase MinD [Nanoarchaeota archaeon]
NGKKEKERYFRIILSGEDIYKFGINVGFRNKFKQDRLKKKIDFEKYNTNIKLFPIGKILKDARNENKIPAIKLANLLGCTKQMIYEYEWGLYALSKKSANQFLEALNNLGATSNKIEFINKIISRGYSFRRVENVEEIEYNCQYVYDFQVCEEGGHFVHGTGIVISNTTTAINLAVALNSLNENVVVVDTNLTTPDLGVYLGAPIVPVSLTHVLLGKADVDEAIYEHESGTKIVPCSLSIKEMEKVKPEKIHDIAKRLRKISDYIIFDSAAGLGEDTQTVMEAADEIIIVANPELPSVTDALKTAKIAENLGKPVRGVIITRVKKDGLDMPYANVKEMLEVPILGVVPEDSKVRHSHVMKNAVFHTHPKSKAAKAYLDIAKKITGKDYPKKRVSLWQRLFG